MNNVLCESCKVFIFISFLLVGSAFAQNRSNNSISGFIFDSSTRIPVPDVYVELLNDTYSSLRRIKTDGSGRYFFNGMTSGTYKIKVVPVGTNFLTETRDVEVVNYNVGNMLTSDNVYLDIYLKLDKRKTAADSADITGVVFAQNIPPAAQTLYKKALSRFENSKTADLGLEDLKKALEIFPDYYDALSKLGIEYIRREKYFEALPYLVKAIQINQRSFPSFYALGIAAYNLKQMKEASEAFRATTIINPQSPYAFLQYGKTLRINNNLNEAEKALLKAKELAKDMSLSEINWQLGLLFEKTQRFNQAADELETYLKIEKEIPNAQQVRDLIKVLRTKAQSKTN